MKISLVEEDCYTVEAKDGAGGILRTDVFKFSNGLFEVFSLYAKDKNNILSGYGADYDEQGAIALARHDLNV